MLDRTIPPASYSLKIPKIAAPEITKLSNGIELSTYLSQTQNLVSIELVFPFSDLTSENRQKDNYAFRMLLEGTVQKSSKKIADSISFLGASIEISHHPDFETISISCLSRVFPDVLQIMKEIWNESVFPEKEWNTIRETTIQQNAINLQKTGFMASKLFRKKMYGANLDYGYSLDSTLIQTFTPELLQEKFNKQKQTGPALALVSGWLQPDALKSLKDWLNEFSNIGNLAQKSSLSLPDLKGDIYWEEMPDSQQTTLRIGKWTIDSLHPDSSLLNLVLEIYGGYFGSRLMGNIREDKGWTYGIFAQRVPNTGKPYWQIGTDIKGEVALEAISEIKKEAEILRSQLVDEEELDLVKNYMIGQFISSVTNCYGLADRYKSMWLNGQSFERMESNLKVLENATQPQVLETAGKYLSLEDAIFVLAGKKPD